ncbi:hypothetical protein, partial [Sphingobacterium sp. UBA5639]|uniref:hypothetical protein n=1 Tax=Sphingobacterium sp. UBA5639 TaxID=1947501 RepID=UPI00257F8876
GLRYTPKKVSPLFCVAQIYGSYKLFANEKHKIKLTSCYIATYSSPDGTSLSSIQSKPMLFPLFIISIKHSPVN